MIKEQAIKVIEQAINQATLKGAYTLTDISVIIKALEKINELVEIVPLDE
jgi:hypothetical protein